MAISRRIASIHRSGIREIFDHAQRIPDAINLAIGEPDFRTPKFIEDTAKKAIDEGFDKYTLNIGIRELREAISEKLKRENNIQADPKKEIIVTAGSTQAIFLVIYCLLEEGEEVLIPSPAFTAYEYAARLASTIPVLTPMKENENYEIDVEALGRSCSKKTKLVVLNSPCNPTGVAYAENEIKKLIEFVLEKDDLYLLSDEIYEKYLYDGMKSYSPASMDEIRDRVITVNGFSKTYGMTGWRLGYAAANEEIISAMTRFNMYNSVCANSIAQRAGVAALNGPQDFFDPILRKYERARKIMCKYLDELGLPYVNPTGAFYVLPRISSLSKSSLRYCERLLEEKHVATVPGSSFGKSAEGHIRLSYSIDQTLLHEAMGRIKKFNRNFN